MDFKEKSWVQKFYWGDTTIRKWGRKEWGEGDADLQFSGGFT